MQYKKFAAAYAAILFAAISAVTVSAQNLTPDIPSLIREDIPDYPSGQVYAITDLSVKTYPDTDAPVKTTIFTGTLITAEESDGEWSYLPDYEGYVFSGYLSDVWDGVWPMYAQGDAAKYCGSFYKTIASLPMEIKEALRECEIEIVNDKINGPGDVTVPEYGYVLGLTSFTEDETNRPIFKKITICAWPGLWESVLCHECGHVFDLTQNITENEDIKQLLNDNIQEIYDASFVAKEEVFENEKEAFAESFAVWMTQPERLKEYAPEVYNKLDELCYQIKIETIN